ncbi:MAG: hypothetical protein SVV80_10305 [Planctomycetota bacterium]|nr:hypothetical protein [Planctomycetota bacterium]
MDNESKRNLPSWMKTVTPIVAAAIVFGTAGYFITPRSAQSALQDSTRSIGDIQNRLDKAVTERENLNKQLSDTRTELASAVTRAADAAQTAEAEKAKAAEAEKFIAQLNEKFEQEKQAHTESLAKTEKLAADNQAQAEKARIRADGLTNKLLALREEKQNIEKVGSALRSDRAKLAAALKSQQQTSAELKRFLTVLDLGDKQTVPANPTVSQRPAEMPITTGELIRRMGYPSLTFQRLDHVEMKWGEEHTVLATGGVVTQIDGESASREALASSSVVRPTAVNPPGEWRIEQGGKVYYADLVDLFGRPDWVAGTGSRFQACWSVGAWAREFSATVVDGLVTQLGGRSVDGATCCRLVRHRTVAYKSAGQDVHANASAARQAYKHAVTVVGKHLDEESARKARDGVRLAKWNVAPLESVGTWVGPANASAGSATVRAWVDCTWAESDGSNTCQRRYFIVTLFGKDQKTELAECTIFTSHD